MEGAGARTAVIGAAKAVEEDRNARLMILRQRFVVYKES